MNLKNISRLVVSFLVLAFVAFANADENSDEARLQINLNQGELGQTTFDDRGRLCLAKEKKAHVAHGRFTSAVVDRGQSVNSQISWIEQWTTPLTWKKHESNPIFGPKQTGDWDAWTNGVSIVRNADGKSYKMFYSGRSGSGIGFAEAMIDQPLIWKENAVSPILRPRTDNWEGNLLNQPRVVKVTDNHWRMYYTGWGFKGKGSEQGSPWAFGLAESHDAGVSWKRVGDEPLLERGDANSPDGGGVFVPEVRRIGKKWMMWYTAMKAVPGKQNIHLCLATSDDGLSWTKSEKNPVLTDDFSVGPKRNVISRCFVHHEQGVFKMWYSHAKPDYRIRYAESLDGADWELSPISPVLGPGPEGAWDSQMVEYPEVDVVDNTYRLWFCGNGFGTVGYSEGVQETGIELFVRSGGSKQPGSEWSKWLPVTRDGKLQLCRFVQIRAKLWTKNPKLTPALNSVWMD